MVWGQEGTFFVPYWSKQCRSCSVLFLGRYLCCELVVGLFVFLLLKELGSVPI